MIQHDFHDLKVSGLGMGCMRLPLNGPKDTDIDFAKAQEIIDYAMANGINYFDTAYVYHTFNSEKFLGEAIVIVMGVNIYHLSDLTSEACVFVGE